VRAEVHIDDAVAIFDMYCFTGVGSNAAGLDELVVFATLIGSLQRSFRCRIAVRSFAAGQQVISGLYAIPAVVAIHGIVATNEGHDASVLALAQFSLRALQGCQCATW